MHDYYYAFKSLNLNFDQFFSSYNNSSFRNQLNLNPTYSFYRKVKLFSEKYEKIYLILSFNHRLNYNLSNKNDDYFVEQKKITLIMQIFLLLLLY